jgi:hypothetical protein
MASRFLIIVFLFFFYIPIVNANDYIKLLENNKNSVEIRLLDKITSKIETHNISVKNRHKVRDFVVFIDKCVIDTRRGFKEYLAYIQIEDQQNKTKDRVYLFNGWMFASNPSATPFEHPNYDLWIKKCS